MNSIVQPVLVSCLILVILLTGCTGNGQPGPSGKEEGPASGLTPGPSPESLTDVVLANNRFACDLYHNLTRDPAYEGGNIFFSPSSLSSALAITYEGAKGETADEIQSVFHFPDNRTALRSGYAGLIARMNDPVNPYMLRTANALWAEKTHPFLPEYISTADRYYSAKTTNLDFVNQPDESRITINNWVEEKTEDKIQDLIPPGGIDSMTALVITNAIYFKGSWVKQFDPEMTHDAGFMTGTGTTVQVPMMQRTDDDAIYGYYETDTYQALSMPYESGDGHELSMLILLPRDPQIDTIDESLSAGSLENIRSNLTERQVKVYLPKFTMETKYFLPKTLSKMRMPGVFTSGADFSGMDGSRLLFISDIIHQAFVDVNEEGTEAAAATAVIMAKGAFPGEDAVPVFRADHPFIFVIQDSETGNILFLGRMSNPVST